MVDAIAGMRITTVVSAVTIFAGSEAAQAVRSEEMLRANLHDIFLLAGGKRAKRKGDGQNLIRAQGRVRADFWSVDDVIAALAFGVPELYEAGRGMRAEGLVALRRAHQDSGKLLDGFESVDPQRIYFDGLSGTRGDHPIADFRVHPGELQAGTASVKQAVGGVDVNVVPRAGDVCFDHGGEHREKFLQGDGVLRDRKILADGFEIPECGVYGVVFGRAAGV